MKNKDKSYPNTHFAPAIDSTNIQYTNNSYRTGKYENTCLHMGTSVAQISSLNNGRKQSHPGQQ